MRVEPQRTRITQPPADDAGVPALVDAIRDEITRLGPISFARFMELALYETGLGYYATSEERATRNGDFLTAPELHPVFAATVARQVHDMRTRLGANDFTLREYGAGTGVFGGEIARRLGVRYEPLEVRGRRLAGSAAGPMVGVVLANELADALPFHRVIRRDGELKEMGVGWADGRFVEREVELSDGRLRAVDDPIPLPEGQQTEISLAMGDWLRAVAADLTRGYLLIFDYALPQEDLYVPSRATGTARAFRGHHVSSDLLGAVGRQDLTAHVNLDALVRGAVSAGFEMHGIARQNEFLIAAGLDAEYAAARPEADLEWESAVALRSAVQRLLDPRQLGGYRVVVLGKDVEREPALLGLTPIKR